MRLLWLTENYYPGRGGMAESCDRIVHWLRRSGITVDVAHFTGRPVRPGVEAKYNGRLITCPVDVDPAHAINCLWNTIASSGEQKPSIVVAFGGTLPLLAGPVFAAWLGVPLVTLLRGNDFDVAVFSPRRGDVLRNALERSSRVCVVSRDKVHRVSSLFPETDAVWIPNGIDLAQWQPLPSHQKRAAGWTRQTVEPGRRVLGMFGHIKQKKGGLFFLEALLASGCAGRFHMLFVGELESGIVEWLASNAGEVPHTTVPFVDRSELMPYYLASDLVVISSFYDGMPNVLLESAALKVPMIASTAGGMGDVLVDGEHGFLFYPGDSHECRRAIMRAGAATDGDLARLGSNCFEMVRDRLNHRMETDSYLQLFREVEREGPKPRSRQPFGSEL